MALLLSVAILAVNFVFTAKMANLIRSLRPFDYARALAILLLLIALSQHHDDYYGDSLPEGYFILLRWIACPVLVVTAYRAHKAHSVAWAWIYGLDAAVLNPIFLSRLGGMWAFVDFVTAALIAASFFVTIRRTPKAV